MAKIGARELELREMRERNAAPVKTSRGERQSGATATRRPVRDSQPTEGEAGPREINQPVVAQEVERPICNREVSGSIPLAGTKSKRGRPRIEDRAKTLRATEPWADLGMSRRTWYRRQAEKKAIQCGKR